MALEVLRAQLTAAGNLRQELGLTATAARKTGSEFDDLADEANSAGSSAAVFSDRLNQAGEEATSLAARQALVTDRTDSLGDQLLATATNAVRLEQRIRSVSGAARVASNGLSNISDKADTASLSAAAFASRIDDVTDELTTFIATANTASASTAMLSGRLDEAADESDGLSVESNNAGASAAILSEGLDEAAETAAALAAKEAVTERQTDDLGDQLRETAASALGLTGQLRNTESAAEDAGSEFDTLSQKAENARQSTNVFNNALDGLGGNLSRFALRARLGGGEADGLGNGLLRTAATATGLTGSVRTTEAAVKSAGTEFDELSLEAANAGASAAVFAEGLEEAGEEAIILAQKEAIAKQQTDSLADRFRRAALDAIAFGGALNIVGDETDDAGGKLPSLGNRIKLIAAIVAAAIPPLLAFASALGGVLVGGATVGAGIFAISAAGIQKRAKETAALSSELETAADAREQIFADFKSRLGDAFAPLQNAAAEQFAFQNLEAVVSIAERASDSLLRVQDTIIRLGTKARGALVDISGETFTTLANQVERLEPVLVDFGSTLRGLPGFIRFLGDAAVEIGPEVLNLLRALSRITGGLADFGIALLKVVLPPLNAVLGVFAFAADLFGQLPDSLQLGIAAFTAITAAVVLFSAATGLAAAAVTAITAPITATAVAIALVTAGLVILLKELGLLGGTLEFIANPLKGFGNIIDTIAGGLDDLLPDIKLFNDILEAVGLNGKEANEQLDNLNPGETDPGSGEDRRTDEERRDDQLKGFVGGGIGLGLIGGVLGGVAGSVVPGAGTLAGVTIGASLGTATGAALGVANASDPNTNLDAGSGSGNGSGSGSDGTGQSTNRNRNEATIVQNNDITVNNASEPTQTRDAVRRGIEEANRQRRNTEGGRVD